MIKTIFFDFGGVLSENTSSWDGMYKRVRDALGLTSEELERIRHIYWEDISVNKISFIKFLEEAIKISPYKPTVDQLLKMFAEDTKINQEVVDIIKDLKKENFRMVLFANESKLGEAFRLKLVEHVVDKIYSSATMHLRKPDPEAFNFVLKMEKVKPEEALFIDDKERNTLAAEKLGINCILYKDPHQLLNELKNYL